MFTLHVLYISLTGRGIRRSCLVSLQGLLALEGELTPILVQMVKSGNMNGLLDSDSDSLTDCQQKVKARLHEIMQKDQEYTQDDYQKVCEKNILEWLDVIMFLVLCLVCQ